MSVPSAVHSLLRSPLAYHRAFAEVAGDVAGAVFLSWLLGRLENTYSDGSVYLSVAECYQETGITRHQQGRIRQILRAKGVLLEHASGFPQKTSLSIDRDRLVELLAAVWDGRQEIARRALHDGPDTMEPESGAQGAGKRLPDEPESGSLLARSRGEESFSSPVVPTQGETKDKTQNSPPPTGPPSQAKPPAKERHLYKPGLPSSPAIPELLQTAAFLDAWTEWWAERRERGDPLTDRAAKLQLRKLHSIASRRGVAVAVQTIERSIECAWTGLFEPNPESARSAGPAARPASSTVPDADATALEVGRRRLFELAFEARRRDELTDAELEHLGTRSRTVGTIAELDTLGRQFIRGW